MKTGLVVAIHDVKKQGHIEMLPIIFKDQESIDVFCERRLNPNVTVVVSVTEISVPEDYELFSWTRKELEDFLNKEDEKLTSLRAKRTQKLKTPIKNTNIKEPPPGKPSWDDAPDWANSLGVFGDGLKMEWCWASGTNPDGMEFTEQRPVVKKKMDI